MAGVRHRATSLEGLLRTALKLLVVVYLGWVLLSVVVRFLEIGQSVRSFSEYVFRVADLSVHVAVLVIAVWFAYVDAVSGLRSVTSFAVLVILLAVYDIVFKPEYAGYAIFGIVVGSVVLAVERVEGAWIRVVKPFMYVLLLFALVELLRPAFPRPFYVDNGVVYAVSLIAALGYSVSVFIPQFWRYVGAGSGLALAVVAVLFAVGDLSALATSRVGLSALSVDTALYGVSMLTLIVMVITGIFSAAYLALYMLYPPSWRSATPPSGSVSETPQPEPQLPVQDWGGAEELEVRPYRPEGGEERTRVRGEGGE